MTNFELKHHGILGQKWGIRRFQDVDGSLTRAGQGRYNGPDGEIRSTRKGIDVRNPNEKQQTLNEIRRSANFLKSVDLQQRVSALEKDSVKRGSRALAISLGTSVGIAVGAKVVPSLAKCTVKTFRKVSSRGLGRMLRRTARGVADNFRGKG